MLSPLGGLEVDASMDSQGVLPIKGSSVTLKCSVADYEAGNPPADSFVWLHQGRRIKDAISGVYHTPPIQVATQGNYSCAAVSKIGQGPFGSLMLKAKGKQTENLI